MDTNTIIGVIIGVIGIIVSVIGYFFASKKKTYKNNLNFKNIKDSEINVRDINIGDTSDNKKDKK